MLVCVCVCVCVYVCVFLRVRARCTRRHSDYLWQVIHEELQKKQVGVGCAPSWRTCGC